MTLKKYKCWWPDYEEEPDFIDAVDKEDAAARFLTQSKYDVDGPEQDVFVRDVDGWVYLIELEHIWLPTSCEKLSEEK